MAPCRTLLEGAERPTVARFSPRGRILAVGLQDGSLHVFSVEAGTRPLGHGHVGEPIRDVLYAPRLSLLVTCGERFLRGWRIPDVVETFEVEVGDMSAAVFSVDGNGVVAATASGLRRVDLQARRIGEPAILPRATTIERLFRLDADTLLAVCDRNVLQWIDEASLEPMRRQALTEKIDGAALDASSQHLATCGEQLMVTSLFDGRVQPSAISGPFTAHPVFSADGRLLFAGTPHGAVVIVDRLRDAAVQTLQAHDGTVTAIDLLHGHANLVTCGVDGRVCLWDLRQARR